MAREAMVTRTIATTVVNVLCINVETRESFNKEVTIPRAYKNNEAVLKAVKPIIETETNKVVHVIGKYEVENLYGMTEQEFIEHAKQLPPRGTK